VSGGALEEAFVGGLVEVGEEIGEPISSTRRFLPSP